MPTWLPSGRMLVFDNGLRRGYTRVVEVDPMNGEIVWQYPTEPDAKFLSEYRGGSQRLANGNTLICESERGHVIEVTREGEIVWEFWNPELTEKGRKRIYRMNRISTEDAAALIEAGG
jgi:outer membrane protein assembly factor BamB